LTGISEILVLLLLITCVLILPRMFKGEPAPSKKNLQKKLTAKIRLGIVLSIVYPLAAALYFKPWLNNPIPFFSVGVLPVLLTWGGIWILAGRKK